MTPRTRRRFLRTTLPAAAVLLAGCSDHVIGDPVQIHRLEAVLLEVSRVEGGWTLRIELTWRLKQEGMMSGVGVAGPAVAVFDAEAKLVERRPIDLPLVAYEDCEYATALSEEDDEDEEEVDRREDQTTVVRDDPATTVPDRTEGARDDETAATTTCPLRMPETDEPTEIALTVDRFPFYVSFAFDRVDTAIEVEVYEYAGPLPPSDTVWRTHWEEHGMPYPEESDVAPLPGERTPADRDHLGRTGSSSLR